MQVPQGTLGRGGGRLAHLLAGDGDYTAHNGQVVMLIRRAGRTRLSSPCVRFDFVRALCEKANCLMQERVHLFSAGGLRDVTPLVRRSKD